jgi:hypothetical protein
MRRPDCAAAASDSARAVCLALDTLWRASRTRPEVLTAERVPDGWKVRTVPAEASVIDGMGAVVVAPPGRVIRVTIGDSL